MVAMVVSHSCDSPVLLLLCAHVHMRTPADSFAKKWKKFSTDGMDKLLVIADFDFTLTTSFLPNGASCSVFIVVAIALGL